MHSGDWHKLIWLFYISRNLVIPLANPTFIDTKVQCKTKQEINSTINVWLTIQKDINNIKNY